MSHVYSKKLYIHVHVQYQGAVVAYIRNALIKTDVECKTHEMLYYTRLFTSVSIGFKSLMIVLFL